MKVKDWHGLLFKLYTLQSNQFPRIRPMTGRAVVRWKTKRKQQWEKRNVR